MILYEEVLREFQRHKVKYVLVGGIAFNLLGGYRNTLDMDILVEMSDANIGKIVLPAPCKALLPMNNIKIVKHPRNDMPR